MKALKTIKNSPISGHWRKRKNCGSAGNKERKGEVRVLSPGPSSFPSKTSWSWWSLNNFRAKSGSGLFPFQMEGSWLGHCSKRGGGEGKNHGAATSSSSTSFICRLQLFLRRWKRAREGSPSVSLPPPPVSGPRSRWSA